MKRTLVLLVSGSLLTLAPVQLMARGGSIAPTTTKPRLVADGVPPPPFPPPKKPRAADSNSGRPIAVKPTLVADGVPPPPFPPPKKPRAGAIVVAA